MFQFNFPSQYAYSIRENIYQCLIPDEATLDPEYIRIYGVHSTGFKDADQQLANRQSRVMITIPTMLSYYLSGIDITIVEEEDIIDIHRLITGYLDEWRYHLENDVNIRVTEYADMLRGFEEFNEELYNMLTHEEFEETKPKAPDFFVSPLDISGRINETRYNRPTYRDQYGSMLTTIRDREKFENR